MRVFLLRAGGMVLAMVILAAILGIRTAAPAGCRQEDLTALPRNHFLAADAGQNTQPQRLVCLTFDDGPSRTTERILNTLEEKQVPATFFVISADNNRKWLPLVEREAEAGHQIALHTATHDYGKIYTSPKAYWLDIKALRKDICRYVDLRQVTWLRFPGGSTNTVSRKYGGSDIMERLKTQAGEKGYHYIDWNVCAQDAAGGHPSPEDILSNIKSDTGEKTVCVVLMHDTAATSATAEALPAIIDWYREQGFTFCTVEEMARMTGKTE